MFTYLIYKGGKRCAWDLIDIVIFSKIVHELDTHNLPVYRSQFNEILKFSSYHKKNNNNEIDLNINENSPPYCPFHHKLTICSPFPYILSILSSHAYPRRPNSVIVEARGLPLPCAIYSFHPSYITRRCEIVSAPEVCVHDYFVRFC